ncbi:MAG: sigma 54-interacting transcriptional regulator [Bryobacterales bacterium]|nr:sigma 54-interacting transcriptional regulator [Bryobacterales bacterium]
MAKLDPQWRHPQLIEAVFDQLSDALLLYDRNQVIKGANRAAEQLLGISAEALIGRSCREIFRCSECDPTCGVLVSLGDLPKVPHATVKLHLSHGTEKTVLVRTTQLHTDAGEVEGVVAAIQDVSEEYEPHRRQIIAESPAMHELMRFVRRVAMSEATTILLEGENGVGKDLVATTLHSLSPRQSEPFIAINCAAIPETLIESELFGYEKGAFTDARQQKRGLFELADQGTLFLDEIGEIPLTVQAKLLRVLEDQQFRRLGGTKDIRVNLRFVAATNKNLREAVREGAFRQDLYFRLNVIQITIPPLRDRREDIVPLTMFFVEHYNRCFKRQIEGVQPEAANLLHQYSWPGNVRELRNAIERAMILEDGSLISPGSLPISITERDAGQSMFLDPPSSAAAASSAGGGLAPFPTNGPVLATSSPGLKLPWTSTGADEPSLSLEAQEVDLLRQALQRTNGNQTQAARLLSITRDTLRYKIKKHGL